MMTGKAVKAMLTVEEIRTFIEADKCSRKKQLAMVGQRYYEGQHDILKRGFSFSMPTAFWKKKKPR